MQSLYFVTVLRQENCGASACNKSTIAAVGQVLICQERNSSEFLHRFQCYTSEMRNALLMKKKINFASITAWPFVNFNGYTPWFHYSHQIPRLLLAFCTISIALYFDHLVAREKSMEEILRLDLKKVLTSKLKIWLIKTVLHQLFFILMCL